MELGIWSIGDGRPHRVERSRLALELDLEEWITADPSLLVEGLQVVGRQLSVEAGYLDLLCIDVQGRWVVVELKRDRLYREAVAQALDYAACLHKLDVPDLRNLVLEHADRVPASSSLEELVDNQLEQENTSGRDVAVIVAGAGVDPGLERVVAYLSEFDLPVRVVSLEVFTSRSGEQLLVREVLDDETQGEPDETRKSSVEAVQLQAEQAGVGEAFHSVVAAAEAAGLYARAYKRTVMITPGNSRNRFLMLLNPQPGRGLRINYSPDAFTEFFADLNPVDTEAVLGEPGDHWYQGESLESQVSVIVDFLAELPPPSAQEGSADAETVFQLARCVEPGEWTTYGDLSIAAIGRSSAAMSIGNMASRMLEFPNPHRILNAKGKIPPSWTSESGGGPEECRQRLEVEGIRFGADGAADSAQRVTPATIQQRSSQ